VAANIVLRPQTAAAAFFLVTTHKARPPLNATKAVKHSAVSTMGTECFAVHSITPTEARNCTDLYVQSN